MILDGSLSMTFMLNDDIVLEQSVPTRHCGITNLTRADVNEHEHKHEHADRQHGTHIARKFASFVCLFVWIARSRNFHFGGAN